VDCCFCFTRAYGGTCLSRDHNMSTVQSATCTCDKASQLYSCTCVYIRNCNTRELQTQVWAHCNCMHVLPAHHNRCMTIDWRLAGTTVTTSCMQLYIYMYAAHQSRASLPEPAPGLAPPKSMLTLGLLFPPKSMLSLSLTARSGAAALRTAVLERLTALPAAAGSAAERLLLPALPLALLNVLAVHSYLAHG
jgi:hypothetical protein